MGREEVSSPESEERAAYDWARSAGADIQLHGPSGRNAKQMPPDRRSEHRWRYLDTVLYRANSASGEGQLVNVSATGVFVRAERRPKTGEHVQIILQSSTPELSISGTVRWRGRRHDGIEGFGVQLVEPPHSFLEIVRSLATTRPPESTGPHRVAPRFALTLPVAVEFGSLCDAGVLSDISLSGARLEQTGLRPSVGSEVTLVFALGDDKPFEIAARVVRPTDAGGYAVQFEALDPRFKAALAQAALLLGKLPNTDDP
jgi:hypothetical protein